MTFQYEPTIGLEIHAELNTATKMFCNSKNDADETRPNVNVCPVCLAHPGTLPVINREAVRRVLRVGVALGGTLADYTEFDRKNYFYPDLPKGYQISQYEHPLVSGGKLAGVSVTRVHLEEDTASSIHAFDGLIGPTGPSNGTTGEEGGTLVDFNRSGVPLMELVTEPDIKSAEEAGAFARELQLLLRYLGVSNANMEKGEMRVEANVSIAKKGGQRGTKVEIKNLNSFRAMERAVAYEIKRQENVLQSGEAVQQETRGWDEGKQATFSQRIKEESADYRYFPDPDLPSLKLSEMPEYGRDSLEKSMPELPSERRGRYLSLGVKQEDAELFVREPIFGAFADKALSGYPEGSSAVKLSTNFIANDLVKIVRDIEGRDSGYQSEIPISVENFKTIVSLLEEKQISIRSAKDLIGLCIAEGKDPRQIAEEKALFQVSSGGDLETIVKGIIAKNQNVVEDYRKGKTTALEYLVGQSMKALKGAADAGILRGLIKKEIEEKK